MKIGLRALVRSAAVALSLSAPMAAQADVILNFGPAPLVPTFPGATTNAQFQGRIVLSDAAFANGFSIGISNTSFGPFAASTAGLLGFEASITPAVRAVQATLVNYLTPVPMGATGLAYILTVNGGGGQPVTGGITFNNQSSDFRLTFSTATGFSGDTRTDGDFGGCFSAQCTFAGRIAVIVPEPAGLAVLVLGGLALAGVIRRRNRAAA
jgi:hypothetical protein